MVFEDGVCKTQCYWCGGSIEIPVEIRDGTQIDTEHFYVRAKS